MDEVHINGAVLTVIGTLISLLLIIIGFFLRRLIQQFDKLNETMQKIDKDLSGEVGLLKAENVTLKQQVRDLDPLWDRVRDLERDVAVTRSGCIVHCKTGHHNE